MLLNLSNHPSSGWTDAQMAAAKEAYGTVEDLPFPNIPPELSEEQLGDLVADYYAQVRRRNPAAVHLMGEMTFTFALVQKLKAAAIPCLASTTERIVEEQDGKKTVQFRFVRFRKY